jgi:catechol 2,3-dioxygenase-like lactoylglutathione lyase family enzyme
MTLGPVVPILRSFDEAKAREFYVGFLGFSVDFEHRFADDLPLYMGISRAGCVLHLSEHHGDGTPGAHLRIHTSDIAALHAELTAKRYKNSRPGLVERPWKTRELTVPDPFGNRITFFQPLA